MTCNSLKAPGQKQNEDFSDIAHSSRGLLMTPWQYDKKESKYIQKIYQPAVSVRRQVTSQLQQRRALATSLHRVAWPAQQQSTVQSDTPQEDLIESLLDGELEKQFKSML